jgi:hypothetical protein
VWAAVVAALLLGSGSVSASSPSRVVFLSGRTGVSQLYSVEASGQGLAQLTFGRAGWFQPVASPDGRFVAAIHGDRLWVMRPDGRHARRLDVPNVEGVAWSGDSKRLVYVSGPTMWTIAPTGGPPHLVIGERNVSGPALSSDGRAAAFLHVRSGQAGYSLVVVRNGRARTVAKHVSGPPAWSPDGRWIAIRNQDGSALELVPPAGGAPRVLARGPASPSPARAAWSPDGRRLAYSDRDGVRVVSRSGGDARLLVSGASGEVAWSPSGAAIAFVDRDGPALVTPDGGVRTLASAGFRGSVQGLAGWTRVRRGDRYQPPEPSYPLGERSVEVSGRELRARVPIHVIAADGDRVAYWLCPHALGAWRLGEQPVSLGRSALVLCRLPSDRQALGSYVYDLVLAGDRLAYLTRGGGNTTVWELRLTTLERGDEGVAIATGSQTTGDEPRFAQLEDLVGGGSALVFGWRGRSPLDFRLPEAIWRIDGATPVQVASRSDDLQPLAVDEGRIVVRHPDGSLELLGLDGSVLRTFDVSALGVALNGDDLVALVQGELRDYSASTGELRTVLPLPAVPSLTLDGAALGVVVYTLDGVVHLLRMSSGADVTVPSATAAELTDAGLFYAYVGEEPWPGRIRFVPFDELPL